MPILIALPRCSSFLLLGLTVVSTSCAVGGVEEEGRDAAVIEPGFEFASPAEGGPDASDKGPGLDASIEGDGASCKVLDGAQDCGCQADLDTDNDGAFDCDDECFLDPNAQSAVDWYADCDGDGVATSTAVQSCSAEPGDVPSPCGDGSAPDGGWEFVAGTDCDDEQPSAFALSDWYADCDDDGIPGARATRACGVVGALAAFNCSDGRDPAGGFWSKPGADCDDEIAGNSCDCADAGSDGGCEPPVPEAPRSCLEILGRDPMASDGVYQIDPDGAGPAALLSVRCDLTGGGWTEVGRDGFKTGDSSGWRGAGDVPTEVDTTSTCATHYGAMLGGVNKLGMGASTQKTFALLGVPHTQVAVTLDYIVLDSWDGEAALVYVDGVERYRAAFTASAAAANTCGGGWFDHGPQAVDLRLEHTTNSLQVRVTSTLDQGADDESFGVDKVIVRVR